MKRHCRASWLWNIFCAWTLPTEHTSTNNVSFMAISGQNDHFLRTRQRKINWLALYLTPHPRSSRFMLTWNTDSLWYTLSVSGVQGFLHYGDHSVPTWCNLITVDLGMPRQCPRRVVQNASREHPVLGDRNIRHDRWLINHGGACTVSMGGLPLESTLWAGGHREHQHSHMNHGCIASLTR